MNDKKLLIAGIDLGITTAYAIVDIDGNFVLAESSKQLDINQLISKTIGIGKILIVGTDKKKVPRLVESYVAKTGAGIISPDEDLKIEEKKQIVAGIKTGNDHESDALACALFAYRRSRPLLDKINHFAEQNKKRHIKNKIIELVLLKKISIRYAVSLIEKKGEEESIIGKVVEKRTLNENDFFRIYGKLKNAENETKLLKIHNSNLRNRISNMEKIAERKELPGQNKKKDFRDGRVKFLGQKIASKEKSNETQKRIIKRLDYIMLNFDKFYLLKKLNSLGLQEFHYKNRFLEIKNGDMLLVNDANIVSGEVANILKDRVFVVVHNNQVNKKIQNELPFVFIDAKKLNVLEFENFGFVDKKEFEHEKSKVNWISKVIEDYKKEKEELKANPRA